MNENDFLKEITDKLRTRIEEIDQTLLKGRNEVSQMNEYYWENYAEMDEYGYEIYDNQQALLNQVNANQEQRKLKHRLERMLDAPYFGRVDFRYDGDDESEKFYIGIANFAVQTGHTPLIYDWRAPVSSLFYDYDRGPALYEAPGGQMDGEITSKWQYKIKNGQMVYCFESDTKIDDEILKEELGLNGDVQLKNIVRTIQKEQNAIIRNTKDKILVIQGAAGSGKTSVALHRIAYLLYHDRDRLKASDILILSPSSVFSDYISHILPELGEENIQEMSFDIFAYKELLDVVSDCEDRYDYLEKLMKIQSKDYCLHYQEKQSAAFLGQIESFLAVLEEELMNFKTVKFRKTKMTEEQVIHLFYFRFQTIPLLARMDAIMEYFIDEYETLHGRKLSEEDEEYIRQQFDSMYITKDIYSIYGWLMEQCGYPFAADLDPEKRKLEYEDVFPMLYLKYRLQGIRQHKHIKHLVIDEMQDYSYLQYVILEHLFSCRMTILGDRAQTLDIECQDVLRFLPRIFGRNIRKLEMKKSYRNTKEIATYASDLTNVKDLEFLDRHGKEVVEQYFEDDEKLFASIRDNINIGQDGFETAAIIVMTEGEARDISRLLGKRGMHTHYIDRNSSAFRKGITVTTFYLAKGLEFDQVFGIFHKKENPLEKQAKYIFATRALHELYVYTLD